MNVSLDYLPADLRGAPALPTLQSVMLDIARLTYADHVRLAEALNHSPQVLNELVGKWAQPLAPAAVAQGGLSLRPDEFSRRHRGYFKEQADG